MKGHSGIDGSFDLVEHECEFTPSALGASVLPGRTALTGVDHARTERARARCCLRAPGCSLPT